MIGEPARASGNSSMTVLPSSAMVNRGAGLEGDGCGSSMGASAIVGGAGLGGEDGAHSEGGGLPACKVKLSI